MPRSREPGRDPHPIGEHSHSPGRNALVSYLGTLHLGTRPGVAGDSATVTHAELTSRAFPHLILVPHTPVVGAASGRRHTFLTALPMALNPSLTLRKQEEGGEGGCLGDIPASGTGGPNTAPHSLLPPSSPAGQVLQPSALLPRSKPSISFLIY